MHKGQFALSLAMLSSKLCLDLRHESGLSFDAFHSVLSCLSLPTVFGLQLVCKRWRELVLKHARIAKHLGFTSKDDKEAWNFAARECRRLQSIIVDSSMTYYDCRKQLTQCLTQLLPATSSTLQEVKSPSLAPALISALVRSVAIHVSLWYLRS